MLKNILNRIGLCAFFIILYLFIFNGNLFSLDIENIIAYPVPFNPKIHTNIRIAYKPGIVYPNSPDRIRIVVYDINGDTVFTRDYTSLNIIWNGRNSKGKHVKPGLYIIKISLEDTITGEYGQKMIRILVNK